PVPPKRPGLEKPHLAPIFSATFLHLDLSLIRPRSIMPDFLLLFGERGAIARHGLWKRFPASVITSPNVPTSSLQPRFRPAPRHYPGEFGCTRKLAIAWVGAWRNLPEMRRQFGLSYTTGALETMAHAYHKLGPTAAFSAMRGIVTAVVWDMQTGTLHAFRD